MEFLTMKIHSGTILHGQHRACMRECLAEKGGSQMMCSLISHVGVICSRLKVYEDRQPCGDRGGEEREKKKGLEL